jgi:hypothetical protein
MEYLSRGCFSAVGVNMSWPEIVLLVVIIALTTGAVIVWRKRE